MDSKSGQKLAADVAEAFVGLERSRDELVGSFCALFTEIRNA